jgi:hypothetical protein
MAMPLHLTDTVHPPGLAMREFSPAATPILRTGRLSGPASPPQSTSRR